MTDEVDPGGSDSTANERSDAEKREFLRAVGDELRGDSTESKQVAALLYRVSDVYDPDEDTDPRDVYVNMRNILRVKERGGRDPEPEGI